ncbi:hypothetical protein [Ammonifex degensii]|uniref:hypothetical protein n=1 Tax=Ammonifex degensii TaxID=42838 RepID=UPI00145C8AB8|nr:hypothetical protein [Ammonifex degensii]
MPGRRAREKEEGLPVVTREEGVFVPLPDLRECPVEGTWERLEWWYDRVLEAAGVRKDAVREIDSSLVRVHPEDAKELWWFASEGEDPRKAGAVLLFKAPSSWGTRRGYVELLPGWVKEA